MNPVPSNLSSSESIDSIESNDFAGLALWMAASLAGMATAVLLSRGGAFKKMLCRLGGREPTARRPTPRQSLPMLAGAIIGSSKATIESVFGPPRAASMPGTALLNPTSAFWQSDTWYYPLAREQQMALAINFDNDLAREVEFFTAPLLSARDASTAH